MTTHTPDREKREHARLLRLWATGKATTKQMLRCMDLDRKAVRATQPDMDTLRRDAS